MDNDRINDPRVTDPIDDPVRPTRVAEVERSNNAMWGWIAGGVVLALLLVFVFARGPDGTDTAANNPPAQTTMPRETTGSGAAPAERMTPPATAPSMTPAPSAPAPAPSATPAPVTPSPAPATPNSAQ